MKPKTKIITIEGLSEISNTELVRRLEEIIKFNLADNELVLTQRPKVQVAQSPKK